MSNLCSLFLAWAVVAFAATGCATLSYSTQEAIVSEDAYSIMQDGAIRVNIALVPSLQEVGGAATIEDPRLGGNLIIARPNDNEYVAASSHCTHRAKALGYDHEAHAFRCSAMGKSEFGLDGTVRKGPAERNLQVYEVTLEESSLIISDVVE